MKKKLIGGMILLIAIIIACASTHTAPTYQIVFPPSDHHPMAGRVEFDHALHGEYSCETCHPPFEYGYQKGKRYTHIAHDLCQGCHIQAGVSQDCRTCHIN